MLANNMQIELITVITYHGKPVQVPVNWAPIPLIQSTVNPDKKPSFKKWRELLLKRAT